MAAQNNALTSSPAAALSSSLFRARRTSSPPRRVKVRNACRSKPSPHFFKNFDRFAYSSYRRRSHGTSSSSPDQSGAGSLTLLCIRACLAIFCQSRREFKACVPDRAFTRRSTSSTVRTRHFRLVDADRTSRLADPPPAALPPLSPHSPAGNWRARA